MPVPVYILSQRLESDEYEATEKTKSVVVVFFKLISSPKSWILMNMAVEKTKSVFFLLVCFWGFFLSSLCSPEYVRMADLA